MGFFTSIQDTPSSKKAKNGTPDSRKSSASSRGTVVSTDDITDPPALLGSCHFISVISFFTITQGTPSNKKTKAASPDSKGASSSSESTGVSAVHNTYNRAICIIWLFIHLVIFDQLIQDTPSTKKMKNQTTDKKSGSSSKSTVVSAVNSISLPTLLTCWCFINFYLFHSFKLMLIQDASSNKKAKNGTQDSKKSGTSSKSAVVSGHNNPNLQTKLILSLFLMFSFFCPCWFRTRS